MKKLKLLIYRFYTSPAWKILLGSYLLAIIGGMGWSIWEQTTTQRVLVAEVRDSQTVVSELTKVADEYGVLKNEDQVVKNVNLAKEIEDIQTTYQNGAVLFERRADLGTINKKLDQSLAKFLQLLSERKWEEAQTLGSEINATIDKIIVESVPKVSVPTATSSNSLPGSGYSRQKVATSRGEFVISMIVAPGARAVIETASDNDCSDNCPTKTLAEHISASGGFAGINGAYFCPPDYPKCQGKVNSFDTLAVNGRTKAVLNRANNVYSSVPLVAAYGSSLSFYDQTVQWGADGSGGGGLANYPRLLRDGGVATTEENGKGTRGFIGVKDGAIVIGHIYGASFGDSAEVLKTLGLQNALNLDGGGSTALWYEGSYKAGPGRSLPTAIVLVR